MNCLWILIIIIFLILIITCLTNKQKITYVADKILSKWKTANVLLKNTTKLLNDYNIISWLDCGTLLGAIREKDFISNDTDVDIATYVKNFDILEKIMKNKKIMKKYNLKITRIKQDDPWCGPSRKIISLYLAHGKSIYIDIYFWLWNPKLQKINFKGKFYNIPKDSKDYLAILYGKNWRIPSNKHADLSKVWKTITNTSYYKKNVI